MRMLLLAVLLFTQRPSSLPIQTGTVTGRLLNGDGSPAVKVRVSAMAIPESKTGNDAPALITLTETDTTGRYRLADVPVGRYFIVAGFVDSPTYYPRGTGAAGATAVNVTARATTANIDFRIERPSTGLTVSGRVIVESAQPSGNVQVMLNGGPSGAYTNLNVPAKLDGSFEFVRVRPGTYNISVSPTPFSQPRTVVVAERDVTGLELRIPWTAEVSGRAVVEGGDPVPTFQVSFTGGASRQASSYFSGQPNQTFRATLAEGFYGVTATGIPPGFYVKSITSGTTNLLSDPLRVNRTSLPPEIVVTLGVSTPSPWVKVAGRITGSRPAATSTVTLNGPIGSLQASLAADGSFEFPKVLPGTYTAYTNPGSGVAMQQVTIVVPNRDLLDIELALPVLKEVSGRIIVEDGGPLPRPAMMMTFIADEKSAAVSTATPAPSLAQLLVTSSNVRSGQMPVNLTIQQDGTFKTSLPEGRYQLTVNIPSNGTPPYSVKSFTYGTADLLKDPLRVATSDSAEMRLTFSPTSPNSFAKVSGRVLGLTGSNAAIAMNNPSFYSALTTPVRADGTFEFPKVYSGTYQVRLTGPAANVPIPPVDVNVAGTDVTNVEIVVPRQKEISGRIILEGRGFMPQFSIPLSSGAAPGAGFASTTFFTINPQPDGAFKLTLPEGERQVGRPNGLPMGYALKSIFYGSTDLASSPLKVSSTETTELRVTLTTPDLQPVKVSGKVSGLDATAIGRGTINVSLNATGYAAGVLQAPVSADGSFEFPAVFPGSYAARLTGPVPNANFATANVTVAGSDLTGVELVLPRQKEILGRITLEGRGPMPQFNIPMNNVTSGTPNTANSVTFMTIGPQPDGTFRVTLPEGERRAGPPNQLPAGYKLKAITYGSTDLLTTPMKISTSDVAELRLTVSTPNHIPVKVSGKVSGIDATAAARGPVSVVLNAPGYVGTLQTPVSADGSFEFAEVFPGNYSARTTGPVVGAQPSSIVVGSVDVRNVAIVVPGQKEVTGRVVVEGSSPMPRFGFRPSQSTANPLGGPVDLARGGSTLAALFLNILPNVDGVFRLTLPEGERPLGDVQNLAAGYTLKSATYGTTDLLRSPLKIDKADSGQLVLTLTAPAANLVSVSGRVSGFDPGATPTNATVLLSSSSFVTSFNALIRPDGSFEFPAVFPGNYSAQVAIPGLVTANQATNVVVSDKGAQDLQLAVPRQHTVTTRIVVEGGGPIPRLPLTVTEVLSADVRGPSLTVVLNPQPDGTVRTSLPDRRRLSVTQLPAGYSLKSLMYGETDLRQAAFSPGPADTPQELRITLEKTTTTPWVNVSGRVVGLPPDARNLRVGLNGAFTPAQQAAVNADGTFSFTQVFQGNNTVQLLGFGNPPIIVQLTVGPKDVTDLEIVVRR